MPTGIVQVEQYTPDPPLQVDSGSELEVRGWFSRDFISADGVTPVAGNAYSGEQGPYYVIGASLNGSGNLVVAAHDIQATTLSNPTGNYFEGLWVDSAFVRYLMPNTEGASGWQIPTIYGPVIAFDEIATYNRARRLLSRSDTYFTADETITEILRLAGNFMYAGVGINGITSLSVAPAVASLPIAVGINDPRVSRGTGTGMLVAASVTTILTALITASSAILVLPTDEGSTGRLYGFNRVNGVSFDVASDNGGDSGGFRWFLW